MNRPSLYLLLLLCVAELGGAQPCLEITNKGYEKQSKEVTSAITWWVQINNQCNRSFDADLEVHLLDAQGELLLQTSYILIVPRNSKAKAKRESYMLGNEIDRVEHLEVELEERERPF